MFRFKIYNSVLFKIIVIYVKGFKLFSSIPRVHNTKDLNFKLEYEHENALLNKYRIFFHLFFMSWPFSLTYINTSGVIV
jgi:hypothetical protein